MAYLYRLTDTVRVTDTIQFLGHPTDVWQEVDFLLIEQQNVPEGKPGQDLALKVAEKVHPNDKTIKVTKGVCGGGVEVVIVVGDIDLELIALDLDRVKCHRS